MSFNLDAAKMAGDGTGAYLFDGPIRIDLMGQSPKMFPLTGTQLVEPQSVPGMSFPPGTDFPSVIPLDVVSYGYDYAASVGYIIQCLPESQALGFKEEVIEAAVLACNTGELYAVRDLIENWEATAEIYAIPGEAEKIATYIEASESTREQRRSEGEWDWETERQAFLQTQK